MSKDVLIHRLWIAALVIFPLTVRAQVDVYWNDALDGIQRANLDGTDRRTVIPRMGYQPLAIAFDTTEGHVYWSEIGSYGRIRRTDSVGIEFETVVTVDSVVGMALDEVGRKLYWVVGGSSPSIQRGNLDGTAVETLVNEGLVRPVSIAVHGPSGKIYWSDLNRQELPDWEQTLATGLGTIKRANLDGSGVEEIVADSGLIGMTIDPVNDYVYWSADSSRIKRARLDGSDIEIVIDGQKLSSPDFVGPGIPQPLRIAVDPATGDIYWMSWGRFNPVFPFYSFLGGIQKSNAIGSELTGVGGGGAAFPITYEPWGVGPEPYAVPFDLQILPGTDQIAWTYQDEYFSKPDGLNPGNWTMAGVGAPANSPGVFKISSSGDKIYWDNNRRSELSADVFRSSTDGVGAESIFLYGWNWETCQNRWCNLSDFVYHRERKTFYASDDPILLAYHEETGLTYQIPGVGGYSMALDTVNSKLYWLHLGSYWEPFPTTAGRQNLDGTEVDTLINLGECDRDSARGCPDDLSLDLTGGRMYWRHGSQIKSATLEGSDTTTVVTDQAVLTGFSADWVERKLYWSSGGMLRRSNADGSSIETLWELGVGGSNLVVVNTSPMSKPVALTSPADGSTGESPFTPFEWHLVDGASQYHLQVDPDSQFTTAVIDDSTLTSTSYTAESPLSYSTTYHWRVRAGSPGGASASKTSAFGPWSEVRSFTVAVGTAAEENRTGIPTSYALHTNYPNPFNPDAVGTTITYDLPEATDVRLTVYDALGRTVETIGTWHLAPGTYEATWEPSGVPSGVYLYRLETPEFSQSRRMTLLK